VQKLKKLLPILFFAFVSLAAFGQEKKDSISKSTSKTLAKIAIGLSCGSNITTYYSNIIWQDKFKYLPGLSIGLHADFYNLTKNRRLFIQVGAFYNDYLFKISYTTGYPNYYTVWDRYNYQFIGANIKTSFKIFMRNKFSHYLGLNTSVLKNYPINKPSAILVSSPNPLVIFNSVDYMVDVMLNKQISLALNLYSGLSTKQLSWTFSDPLSPGQYTNYVRLYVSGINFSIKYYLTKNIK
jgi:hypothetical protein